MSIPKSVSPFFTKVLVTSVLYSIDGPEFISISHGCKFLSTRKSYPNSSKFLVRFVKCSNADLMVTMTTWTNFS